MNVLDSSPRRLLRFACASLIAFLPLSVARAASTGQTALHMPQGNTAGTANGDYLTSTAGLNTFYRYFIEVPPGLAHLVVEVFDPDIGRGGAGEAAAGRDRARNDAFGTAGMTVTYTLLRPDGTTAATLGPCSNSVTCTDNGFQAVLDSMTAQNTAAGHWELRVTMGSGDEINAIGVRAHDGTSGAGGTELPVYIDSIVSLGVNPPASGTATRSYTLYPYVTSGCTAFENDFDYDSDAGPVGSIALSSRSGAFTQTIASASLSANNVWTRNTINRWTTDALATEYGIWSNVQTISSYSNNNGINGNYTDVYFAKSTAAANPPAANPVTNGFRMYLPTDAGTAPVKPYLEQLLTFKSGTNPPPVGQTAKYQVTIRLVNPTTRSVVFSAANLVTANVPGGGAVYAGGEQHSQGSVVSAPPVGGTGNITWNPGTVAAGATALFTYQVNVTPTSAGQRIPVTGTPASNGTTAKYVDETGNTTQTRATFTFGPLCELAMTQNLLTSAVVRSFRALPGEHGGVVIEWRTAGEAGTAGFRLLREDGRRWVPVREGMIAGLQSAAQGGTYRVLDGAAQPGGPLTYRLEEIESKGTRRTLGTYDVTASRDDEPAAILAEAIPNRTERPIAAKSERAGARANPTTIITKASANANEKSLWIGVDKTGLYRVDAAAIASASGMPVEAVANSLGKRKALLRRGGARAVAWYPDLRGDGSAAGFYFYGVAQPSNYSSSTPYRLDLEKAGTAMATLAVGGAASSPASDFADRERSEVDAFPATVISPDPDSDYWYWQFLQGGDPTYGQRTFPLTAPAATGASATLGVDLQGATKTGVAGEHVVHVAVNGTDLGSASWTGITAEHATFAVPATVLQASGNQVTLTAEVGTGAPYSIWYVDGFDLDYRRTFTADAGALAFPAGPAGASVSGFPAGSVHVLEVSDPLHPRWVTGASVSGNDTDGYRLTLAPAANGSFVAASTALVPAAIRPWTRTPALRPAALLIVAPASFASGADDIAAARRAAGISTLVLNVDQIADGWGGGVATPQALRAAVRAEAQASGAVLRSLLLLGAGSVDYRDLLGYGGNLVPPWFVATGSGLFSADNVYGDLDGDHVPDLAVGRVPVRDAGELSAWLARQQAYEATPDAAWAGETLLLADAPDPASGSDFAAADDSLAAQLGNAAGPRIELGHLTLGDARQQLFAALANGTGVVNYFGHGALDRLASGGLLASADVPGLTNAPRVPLLTAMTCTVNRIGVPGLSALGELLVRAPSGGAVAVLAPSGLSDHWNAMTVAQNVHAQALLRGDRSLGDWLMAGYRAYVAGGGDPTALDVYELLGDPTTRLHVAPPVVGGGSPDE